MQLRYLLDTNIVSYLMKRQNPVLEERYDRVPIEAIGISVITEAEIFFGLALKPGALRLRFIAEAFLRRNNLLPWDSAAAQTLGRVRAEQVRKGRPLSTEDTMIAAHAVSLDLTLVTHDQAFSWVDGLKTEDWTLPIR